MKHDWEYKKLGEVVSSINGLWTGKKEPFVTIPVISLKNFTKDCKLKKEEYSIIDVEVRQFASRKLQYGDIIIEKSGGSDTQPVGRPILFDIKEGDYSFSNFTATLRVNDANKESLNSLFLHNVLLAYYKQGKTLSLQSKTTGIHNLDLKSYLRLPIPVPSLPTQQSIVSELDSLSKIIADCKETLKDYDALEQSIFYDMFGDPVKNDKGWEVKKLGEVCDVKGGYAFKSENFKNIGIPVLRIGNINSGYFTQNNMVFWNEDDTLEKYAIYPGEMVMSLTGTVGKDDYGNLCILGSDYKKYYLNQRNAKLQLHNDLDKWMLFFLLKNKEIKGILTGVSRGVRQANIANRDIENLKIILPPLSLQQAFASKIEAIEQMKEETKKALQEAETLFQARMDYWFN